ncbi:pleiotropic drug resistance protein, partial [Trifolium medium]|nr:pleiotropic drug resistance protein [Trifolium medium]
VGIELPTIEVRFEHLNIEAEAHVGSRSLPTFTNFMVNIVENDIAFGPSNFWKNYTPVGLGWKT